MTTPPTNFKLLPSEYTAYSDPRLYLVLKGFLEPTTLIEIEQVERTSIENKRNKQLQALFRKKDRLFTVPPPEILPQASSALTTPRLEYQIYSEPPAEVLIEEDEESSRQVIAIAMKKATMRLKETEKIQKTIIAEIEPYQKLIRQSLKNFDKSSENKRSLQTPPPQSPLFWPIKKSCDPELSKEEYL